MSIKKPTLAEALGVTKKLSAEDLKALIAEVAVDEKADPGKVEDDRDWETGLY